MIAGSLLAVVSCLLTAVAADAAPQVVAQGNRWSLSNGCVERLIEAGPCLRTVSFCNSLADPPRVHPVESREFVLALDNESLRLTAVDFQVEAPVKTALPNGRIELKVPLRCPKHAVCVAVVYTLGPGEFYLRKRLEIDPGEHLLNWVDVESLRLAGLELKRFDQEPMPFKMTPWDITVGRPLFAGREMFLGVEHPASLNAPDEHGWISLRQHPGCRGRFTTAPAAIGVCPDRPRERLSDYFERYVRENRARPIKRSIQWVAYFPAGMDDDACRRKVAVAERVFRSRGAPLDLVLMDSGWTDPQSIMRISRQRPDRLALMSKLTKEKLGCPLGLHVITSGVKPMVDKDWLAAQGYDMIYHRSQREGAYCFADPRVLAEFRDNLTGFVRQYGIASYKFDWGHFACPAANHRGHLPGEVYGFEAGATNFAAAQRAFRQANPEIFLFNTGWYSPWWLWTYDAVFAAGADYNFGMSGPPSYSTASLLCTWRDATIRGNVVRWSPFFPVDSLMTVDPISYWWHVWELHAESPLRPFTDYFLTAAMRGTQMTEIYNNIGAWSDAHADAAVAILKWMKAHDDVILASTRYFGGDPLAGETYGYTHFTRDGRGLVVIRNPTIAPRQVEIPLDETAGMWPDGRPYVARVVYPFTMVLPQTFRYGDKCRQELGGEEARVLEFWPQDRLPEPIPIGCRYQVVSRQAQKTTFRVAGAAEAIEFLSPVTLDAPAKPGNALGRYVLACPEQSAPRQPRAPETISAKQQDGQIALSLTVPDAAQARLSLLFPVGGLDGHFIVDGRPVTTDTPHIRVPDAGHRDKGTRANFGKQSLFGVDLSGGPHEVRFEALRDRKPAPMPSGPAQVVFESFEECPGDVTIEVRHAPIDPKESPSLPQNWSWQVRTVAHKAVP